MDAPSKNGEKEGEVGTILLCAHYAGTSGAYVECIAVGS